MLVGRETEAAKIDALMAAARSGHSSAVVIRGEAGIGKSALLEHAVDNATGMRVLRAVGVEAEAEYAFGGLHQLLHPFLDRIDALPAQQAAALRTAFDLVDATGEETNRFRVGAATLSLVAALAEEEPVLCVIDDAQWLDRGTSDALLFAARRFHADAVAVLLAVRETAVPYPTPGIGALHVTELSGPDAADLLRAHSPDLTTVVRDRVLREARGNPLAIIELGAAQHGAAAHPLGPLEPLPASGRVQLAFRAQIGGLDPRTRAALLIAAADGAADLALVLAVGARFGVSVVDLAPAERAHLVVVDGAGVRFRHPLVRAAAYQVPEHHQRLAVHAAFAAELTGPGDPDRRAWHLAAAVTGTDEVVAAELDRTAERALRRGDVMTVSAACDRAARLSTDDAARALRLTRAAQAAWDAGRLDRAARLADEAVSHRPAPALAAEAMFVRAQVEYDRTGPVADAELSLSAARIAIDHAPERAVHMLTEAALVARHTADAAIMGEAVALLRLVAAPPDAPVRLVVDTLIGWGELIDGRPEIAAGPMREMVRAHRVEPARHDWIVAGVSAILLADDADATAVMTAMVAEARESGALGWLPYVLEFRALLHMFRGELMDARSCLAEGIAVGEELGTTTEIATLRAMSVWVAAVSGDGTAAAADSAAATALGLVAGTIAQWGLALADLAAGRLDTALPVLDGICSGPAVWDVLIRAIPDHVEAAVRAGDPVAARRHVEILNRWAAHAGPSGVGLALRCRALLDDSGDDRYFRDAIAAHETAGGRYDLARTRLVYGEWLRRRRRRTDARVQLEAATAALEQMGARPWAARASAELAATGAGTGARPDAADPLQRLTPQEVQVVRMAAAGLSNKEIGAQLYLSPRTVGHHLYRSFQKLGIGKRAELARLGL